jgi:hypothetical protein
VATKLLWTESESDDSETRLMAIDPTADSPSAQTISKNLPTDFGPREVENIYSAQWNDGTTLPGSHYPATVFNTKSGELKRVSAMPSDDGSAQTVSDETDASDLAGLFYNTDFTNLDDTRIFYRKAGSTVLNYVRLGADDTVTPKSVTGSFAFAVRDDDTGALRGFAWLPDNTSTLELRNLDDGSDTELASGVTGVEQAGFVDGERILMVDGELKSYDTGDASLSDVTEGSTVDSLDMAFGSSAANDEVDKLYVFATLINDTTRLIEVDLDADPQAVQLADTGDEGPVL